MTVLTINDLMGMNTLFFYFILFIYFFFLLGGGGGVGVVL